MLILFYPLHDIPEQTIATTTSLLQLFSEVKNKTLEHMSYAHKA